MTTRKALDEITLRELAIVLAVIVPTSFVAVKWLLWPPVWRVITLLGW